MGPQTKSTKKRQVTSAVDDGMQHGFLLVFAVLLAFFGVFCFVLYTQWRIEHYGEYPRVSIEWIKLEVSPGSESNGVFLFGQDNNEI